MPPIRTESSQKSANQESNILLAFSDIKDGCIRSLRAAAKLYKILYAILYRRANGLILYVDKCSTDYKLIQLEKDLLTEWILSMDSYRAVSRPATVREMVNILLAVYGSLSLSTVSKNWLSIFVNCCKELCLYFSKCYNY